MNKYGKEVFRKILHMFAITGVIAWTYYYDDWKWSALVFLLAVFILFPGVFLMSKIPGLSGFINERKKGEFGYSMVALGMMYGEVCLVCWGLLGERLLAIACILAWGPGDAAAALIGKPFGKHRIGKAKKKSLEGSIAMFIVSFIAVLGCLCYYGKYSMVATVVVSLLAATASTFAEFLVNNGYDTFYCPVSAMVIIATSEFLLTRI